MMERGGGEGEEVLVWNGLVERGGAPEPEAEPDGEDGEACAAPDRLGGGDGAG